MEAVALSPERLVPYGLSFLRMGPGGSRFFVTLAEFLGFLLSVPQMRKCAWCLLALIASSSVPLLLLVVMTATTAAQIPGTVEILHVHSLV